MKGALCILVQIMFLHAVYSQCPDGPTPSFWHPDQVDSFKNKYPGCRNFVFQAEMINGEYVKPRKSSLGMNIVYLFSLSGLLLIILFSIKLVTQKIPYFSQRGE